MSELNQKNEQFSFHNDRYTDKPKSLVERWLEDEDGFGTGDDEPIPDDEEPEAEEK